MRVYGCVEKSFTVSVFHCIISWASIAHTPHCQLLRALTSIPQLRPWHQLVAPASADPNPRQKSQNRALDIALLAHAKPHEFSKGLLFLLPAFANLFQLFVPLSFSGHSPFCFPRRTWNMLRRVFPSPSTPPAIFLRVEGEFFAFFPPFPFSCFVCNSGGSTFVSSKVP